MWCGLLSMYGNCHWTVKISVMNDDNNDDDIKNNSSSHHMIYFIGNAICMTFILHTQQPYTLVWYSFQFFFLLSLTSNNNNNEFMSKCIALTAHTSSPRGEKSIKRVLPIKLIFSIEMEISIHSLFYILNFIDL